MRGESVFSSSILGIILVFTTIRVAILPQNNTKNVTKEESSKNPNLFFQSQKLSRIAVAALISESYKTGE